MLLYGLTSNKILDYEKVQMISGKVIFLGMDVVAGEKKPSESKNDSFSKLEQLNTWGELRMLIGIFLFYIQFLPL